MKGRDFISTWLQSWDIPIGSNAIDIASEIAKNNRSLKNELKSTHIILKRQNG